MAECSQEFQGMLYRLVHLAYIGGMRTEGLGTRVSTHEAAILQYVARLEAIRDKAREVAGPLAADMVGGMP